MNSINVNAQLTVTVDTTNTGIRVPVNFVGFSFDMSYWTTSFSTNKTITQQLFNNLYPYQQPVVRILANNGFYWKNGSFNTAPSSWNLASGAPYNYTCTSCLAGSPGLSSSISTTHLDSYKSFVQGLNYYPTTLFGVSLAFLDPNRYADFASEVKNRFNGTGYDYYFEIGNEPDLYVSKSRRNSGYNATESTNEFNLIKNAISSYGKIAGPVLAKSSNTSSGSWSGQIGTFITNTSPNIVTMHDYPLGDASGVSSGSYPNYLAKFLNNNYSYTEVNNVSSGLITSINTCKTAGVPFRLAEANSIASSGISGVSDAFGSALWGMDFMFELAKAGASGINFMTAQGTNYSPFLYGSLNINPLYYGTLMFARCVQNNAQILNVTPANSVTNNPNIKAWVTKDANNIIRVLLINRGSSTTDASSSNVTINIPGANAIAKRYDLTTTIGSGALTNGAIAQTVSSGAIFTLAGQTVSNSDGTLQGTLTYTTLQPSNNSYTISLPAASATYIETQATNDFYSQTGDITQTANWNTKFDGSGFALGTSISTATINFHSTQTQNLSAPLNILNGSLSVENNSTLTVTSGGSVTLGPSSQLTVNSGSNLDMSGNSLALQSSSSGTATVNTVAGTLSGISNVTVQRYINNSAAWRMIGFPLSSSTTISASALSTLYGSGYNAYTYNETLDNGAYNGSGGVNAGWTSFTSSATTTADKGILMIGGTPTSTLSATGTLNTGTQTITLSSTSGKGWNLIANPFASNITWSTVQAASTNVDATVYRYDPNTSAYASYNATTTSQTGSGQNNIIENGAGFFVHVTTPGSAASLSVAETAKTSTAPASSLMGVQTPSNKSIIKLSLSKQGDQYADEVVLRWGGGFAATDNFDGNFDAYDLGRAVGPDLSVIGTDKTVYSIFHGAELKNSSDENRTVQLGMKNMAEGTYQIGIQLQSPIANGNKAYLYDSYTGTYTLIDDNTSNYSFITTSDTKSQSSTRFSVVMNAKQIATVINDNSNLPVILLNNPSTGNIFTLYSKNNYNQLQWQVIDGGGRVMQTGQINSVMKGSTHQINAGNTATGNYFIKLNGDGNALPVLKAIKN